MSSSSPEAPTCPNPSLEQLEQEASTRGLLLRLQVSRPAGLAWGLRVGVARRDGERLLLLGELKGWALPSTRGLRLDTMRVQAGDDTAALGPLIWAATFAWALEATPCRQATILAIRDSDVQHRRLVRYFRALGFGPLRELAAGPADLAPRLLWGGSGLLMRADCAEVLRRSVRRLGGLDGL
ncbi:MAG: hypothetical protein ACI9IO_000230 [Cyanobium sp.]|jgi:hypothetical protein|uniref:hypothetical protein n=1 Tax=Synechococcus sp. CS-1331 TaxID=2847973 RepID=UPI0019B2F70F|nr:hypothetical protein [Synechococcus sp. CS-1331]MCT0227436.1 hypothetical protein [Synechococcus sp. CS-1331]NQW37980.1 hypothetical protein [Cyanobacteria bacterium bin.275]